MNNIGSIDYVARRAESVFKDIGYDFSESQEKVILKMITDFSPLLSQVAMTDSVGHKNMSSILKKKINEVIEEISDNQYLAFLLIFVLADIDLENNISLIRILMDKVTIPILKSMLYFKLNYYMAFKAGGKKQLQSILSGMIRDQRHNMDKTIKDSEQQKTIHESLKRSDTLAQKGTI